MISRARWPAAERRSCHRISFVICGLVVASVAALHALRGKVVANPHQIASVALIDESRSYSVPLAQRRPEIGSDRGGAGWGSSFFR